MLDKLPKWAQDYRLLVGIGIFLILISVGGYRWWIYPAAPAEAIPAETAVVFRFQQPKSKEYWKDSLPSADFFRFFPSLLGDYRNMQPLLGSSPYVYAIEQLGEGNYALSAAVDGGRKTVLDSLHLHYHRRTSVYLGTAVHQLSLPAGDMAYSWHRNLLLLGRLPLQVERQLAQLKEGSTPVLPAMLLPNQGALFSENLPAFLAGYWKGAALSASREWAEQQAKWSFRWERDSSGMAIQGGGGPKVVPSPADSSAYRILPYLPAELAWCRWSYFEQPGSEGGDLFNQHVRPWLGNDCALLQMPLPGRIEENQVLLVHTLDAQSAEEGLTAIGEQRGTLDSYPFQLFTVRHLFAEGLLSPLGIEMENPYTVVLGDYVAFSPGKAALEQSANAYLLSQHLATQPAFQSVWPRIADSSAVAWWFFNGRLGRSRLPQWLASLEDETMGFLSAYPLWAGSRNANGDFRLYGKRVTAMAEQSVLAQLWVAPLEAAAATRPYAYPEGGFLLQDAEDRLYFFNEKGERLWTFPLANAMLGAPHWVDYFESGPPCIAFCTRERLYVLGPNGKVVGRYPRLLPAPALGPLLVASMEGERAFRLFVSTEKGIFGYTREGQSLPAWSPYSRLDSTVRQTMRYRQYGKADHMIALTEKGTLYDLQRDGQNRFDSLALGVAYGATFSSPPYMQADNKQQRIAVGDEQGFVHAINLEGTHFRLRVLPGAAGMRFRFEQLLGDRRRDYLAWDDKRLTLHYYEGQSFKKQLDYRFPSPPDEVFVVELSGEPHIGWRSGAEPRVYLMTLEGEMLQGFPLAGSTAMSSLALPDGGTMLVVGYGRRVYSYLPD